MTNLLRLSVALVAGVALLPGCAPETVTPSTT